MEDKSLKSLEQRVMDLELALNQFKEIANTVRRIEEVQTKMANALIGSFDKTSVGLLEEVRVIRKDLNDMQKTNENQKAQLEDVVEFKKKVKMIMVAIGACAPIAVELIKYIWNTYIMKSSP